MFALVQADYAPRDMVTPTRTAGPPAELEALLADAGLATTRLQIFTNAGEASDWRAAALNPQSSEPGHVPTTSKGWADLVAIAIAASNSADWSGAQQLWMTAVVVGVQLEIAESEMLDALTNVLRTALAIVDGKVTNAASPDDILRHALQVSPVARATVARSVLQMVRVPDLIERLQIPPKTRGALGDALAHVSHVLARSPQASKLKGFHDWWGYLGDAYLLTTEDLDQICRLVATTHDFGVLRQQRERFMKLVERISYFSFGPDLQLVHRLKGLLGEPLTDYASAGDERVDAAYITLMGKAQAILTALDSSGGHLSRCVVEPLLISVAATVKQHYQATVGSAIAELRVRTVKPEAALSPSGWRLELEIVNSGHAVATGCELSLVPDSDSVVAHPGELFVARLGADQSRTVEAELRGTSSNPVELMYELTWADRSGPRHYSDILVAAPQTRVDWDRMSALESPYSERPIEALTNLKGRQTQLDELRLGFQVRKSFLVTGQKRVGKTSLVHVLLSELGLAADVLAVHIMVGELSIATGGADLGQVGAEIIDRVNEAATRKHALAEVPVPSRSDLAAGFNAAFTKYFRTVSAATSARVAIAIDDLDELPQEFFRGVNGKAFFLALRSLITNGHTSFILIGSEILPGILREQAMRLNLIKTLTVDYLDREASRLMIEDPGKEWLRYTADAVYAIGDWTACNPYFTNLICDQLWQSAVAARSYWIVRRDIDQAVGTFLARSEATQFKHFWSDSPSVTEDERTWNEGKSAAAILALATLQQDPFSFALRQAVARSVDGLSSQEAESQLALLESRRVVAAHQQNANLIRLRVPLFAAWVQGRGAIELRETARDLLGARGGNSPIRHDEVLTCGGMLIYRGLQIGPDSVRAWLAQFGEPADQRLVLRLLDRVGRRGLFTENRFRTSLRELHALVRQTAGQRGVAIHTDASDRAKNCLVTYGDSGTSSGSTVARAYRTENRIPKQYSGEPAALRDLLVSRPFDQLVLVCVDDVVGSGQTAMEALGRLKSQLLDVVPGWEEYILVIYGTVVGFEDSLNAVTDRAESLFRGYRLPILTANRLTSADRAFDPENDLFSTPDERLRAMDLATEIGGSLERQDPLGRDGGQGLIVFPDTVPNNTLPIFWKEGAKFNSKVWLPLFPRS